MKRVGIGIAVLIGILLVAVFITSNQVGIPLQFNLPGLALSFFGSVQENGLRQPRTLPLWLVLFGTFILGFLASTLLGISSAISARYQLYKLNQHNKNLTKEINTLRNIPLQEGPLSTPPTSRSAEGSGPAGDKGK